MAQIDRDGNLDYSMEDYLAPAPSGSSKRRFNPLTGLPEDGGDGYDPGDPPPYLAPGDAPPSSYTYPWEDPNWKQSTYDNGGPTSPGSTTQPGRLAPTGGSINDPAYLDYLIDYYGNEPGSNPSVKNDPGYWKGAAPRFNGDTAEFIKRMMTPEGAPEGAGAPGAPGGTTGAGGPSGLSAFLMSLLGRGGGGSDTGAARTSLLSRLNALADRYSQPVSADDPNIQRPTEAYTGQVGRSVNMFRKTAAERAYAEGVPTGSFDAAIGNAELSGGRAVGDFETGLMHDEMLSRRNALMQTLQTSGGLLNDQDSTDIQNKIAAIDASLKSRGMDITESLGTKGLDLQKLLGMGSLDLQGKSVNNQRDEFYDQLGTTNAHDEALLKYLYEQLKLN